MRSLSRYPARRCAPRACRRFGKAARRSRRRAADREPAGRSSGSRTRRQAWHRACCHYHAVGRAHVGNPKKMGEQAVSGARHGSGTRRLTSYRGTASAVPAWDPLNMAFRPCNRALASWVVLNELQRRDTRVRKVLVSNCGNLTRKVSAASVWFQIEGKGGRIP